jgi:hypothetical protein
MIMTHTAHVRDPFFMQALSEHRDLLAETFQLRLLFQSCVQNRPDVDHSQELTRRLRLLWEHLSQHFLQEQAGGYLEEAIMRLPRIGPRAEFLQRQHGDLSTAASRLADELERLDPATCDWAREAWEFDQFVQQLVAHEAAENALLQEAFNEDPGSEFGA